MNNNSRRIGALIPPGNVTVEREFAHFAPAGVYVHYNRLYGCIDAHEHSDDGARAGEIV